MNVKSVGGMIRQLRKKSGLTQKALAELSGTATITIQQYESGKRQPRIEQLKKIANALGVTMADLVPDSRIQIELEDMYIPPNADPEETEYVRKGFGHFLDVIDDANKEYILQVYDQLNDVGKSKLFEYAQDLYQIESYLDKKNNPSEDSTEN